MKKTIIFSTALIIGIVFTTVSSQVNAQTTTTKKNTTEQQAAKKYTCTMHPEIVMDKPGKCPKCGMTLIEKTDLKEGGMNNMNMMNMNNMKMNNMSDTTMMKKDSTKLKR